MVAGQLHPHEIRQLQFSGQKTGSGKRALAKPFFRQRQRRQPGVLVHKPTEAALECCAVVAFEARLGTMTLQAEGLQLLLLSGEGLGHGDDVVDLESAETYRRAAQLAHPLLAGQQLLPAGPGVLTLSLQQVQKDLQAGSSQALSAIGHAQALRPLLQHLRILAELPDHTVRSAGHPQPQCGPFTQASHGARTPRRSSE